jgi:hypothetical protein
VKNNFIFTIERLLIILIALHSFACGAGLLWANPEIMKFAGWPDTGPLFFPHQGGIFHFVLGICYMIEYFHYRGVLMLVTAKVIATVFLIGSFALGEKAWVVLFSGIADGLMAIAVLVVHAMVLKARNNATNSN